MIDLYQDELQTPIGLIYIVSDGAALRAIDFEGNEERKQRLLSRHYGNFTLHASANPGGATSRISAYFAGDLTAIYRMTVATNGTAFQMLVWGALRSIPLGSTVAYQNIAEKIGRPKACRAVGLANGANPIAIVVPCHRVVGSDFSLTGYGGGLDRKRWLLSHEGIQPVVDASATCLPSGPLKRPG